MSSSDSDGGLFVIIFFILLLMSTCGTCENTKRIDNSMDSIQSKMDTLIKHQHIKDSIMFSKLK